MPSGQIISMGVGNPTSLLTFMTMGLGVIPVSEEPQQSVAALPSRAPFKELQGVTRFRWQQRPAWQQPPAWRVRR